MLKDLKYLVAYITPLSALIAVTWQGGWSFLTLIIAFLIVPLIEQFAKGTQQNFSKEEEAKKAASPFFDWLLYLNLPLLYITIWCFLSAVTGDQLTNWEIVGMTMSVGIMVGSIGINVAHELGHRSKRHEQWMAKAMLTTALYTQFNIEHNRGHHLWVATDEDPSSARKGENLYQFWIRSTSGVYVHAWRLEINRLKKLGKPGFSLSNERIWLQVSYGAYRSLVWYFFGWTGAGFAVVIAVLGILQLETVNYIEHYGLRRKRLDNGFYEKTGPQHSWNSNHELGRILLYELTRHSDHHFKASRKYQVLRHFDESPQLPHGYPASMLMALVPPLWFSVMDNRIPNAQDAQ